MHIIGRSIKLQNLKQQVSSYNVHIVIYLTSFRIGKFFLWCADGNRDHPNILVAGRRDVTHILSSDIGIWLLADTNFFFLSGMQS